MRACSVSASFLASNFAICYHIRFTHDLDSCKYWIIEEIWFHEVNYKILLLLSARRWSAIHHFLYYSFQCSNAKYRTIYNTSIRQIFNDVFPRYFALVLLLASHLYAVFSSWKKTVSCLCYSFIWHSSPIAFIGSVPTCMRFQINKSAVEKKRYHSEGQPNRPGGRTRCADDILKFITWYLMIF